VNADYIGWVVSVHESGHVITGLSQGRKLRRVMRLGQHGIGVHPGVAQWDDPDPSTLDTKELRALVYARLVSVWGGVLMDDGQYAGADRRTLEACRARGLDVDAAEREARALLDGPARGQVLRLAWELYQRYELSGDEVAAIIGS
jgi:hypothetical protein